MHCIRSHHSPLLQMRPLEVMYKEYILKIQQPQSQHMHCIHSRHLPMLQMRPLESMYKKYIRRRQDRIHLETQHQGGNESVPISLHLLISYLAAATTLPILYGDTTWPGPSALDQPCNNNCHIPLIGTRPGVCRSLPVDNPAKAYFSIRCPRLLPVPCRE